MQYLGGKFRLGGRIVQAILDDLGVKRVRVAVDLCAGAGGVTRRLADVQGGWVPPEHVSEEEYKASFKIDWSDPLATFMGFGCAFGGALAFETDAEVVYCDPPYENTAGYAVPAAVTGAWWHRLAALAGEGRACYLSEYAEAPPAGVEAHCVWTAPTHKTQLTKGTKTERLWRVLPSEAPTSPAAAPEDPPRADPAPPPTEPATAALEPAVNEADPWDALPPIMPVAA